MFILAITPGQGFDPHRWARVLQSGVDAFLIREPDQEAGALLQAARWCRATSPQVELWVGGRLDVALAAGCGLHAPEAYPEVPLGMIPLSRPLHQEAQFPSRQACTQLLIAPVHPTPHKGEPWGVQKLHRFLDTAPPGPRLLALGGISPEHLPGLGHPRLDGVAMIRALWSAEDPQARVRQLRDAGSR